jgi:hypothetical protein
MAEVFGYVYVIGAMGTGLLSARLYFKIFFDAAEKNQSLFGWIFTCASMCPVWALFWPFVIKSILNDLSNFEKNKQRAIKQREYQDWVAGFQEDTAKAPPPWIDPKRFGKAFSEKHTDYENPVDQAKSDQAVSSQQNVTNEKPRQTSEEIRRDAFKQRYIAAQILAQKHNERLKAEVKEKEKLAKSSVSQAQNIDDLPKAVQVERSKPTQPSTEIKKQSNYKGSHTKSTVTEVSSSKKEAFTKQISCPVCRYVLTVDTLDRETNCINCRKYIAIT